MRSRLLILAALAACGTETERPLDIETVTSTVLAPNCGLTNCHSTFTQNDGLVFDRVEAVREMIRVDLTVAADPDGAPRPRLISPIAREPIEQPLYYNLTQTMRVDPPAAQRMPLDAPMPDVDVNYLVAWLAAGAPGACVGEAFTCTPGTNIRVTCGPHATFEFEDLKCDEIMDCPPVGDPPKPGSEKCDPADGVCKCL
jgi:hypothetical protein